MPSSRTLSSNAPIPASVKAVVFDLDGTIYVSKRIALHLIMADIPNMFTLQAERKARKEIKGKDFQDRERLYNALFTRMTEIRGKKDPAYYAEWFHQRYMPIMAAVLGLNYQPRPLFLELVDALKAQGIRVFVYSDYEAVSEKLQALMIDPAIFDGVLDAPTTGGLKPCKQAFERMLNIFGCEADTTLMVGDKEDTDGDGARSVGMPFYNVKASSQAWDELLKRFL